MQSVIHLWMSCRFYLASAGGAACFRLWLLLTLQSSSSSSTGALDLELALSLHPHSILFPCSLGDSPQPWPPLSRLPAPMGLRGHQRPELLELCLVQSRLWQLVCGSS